MAIDLHWDNDAQSVMLCQVDKHWTWDEMDTALAKIKDITDHAAREIAAIIDLSAGISIPGGLFAPSTFHHVQKMLKIGDTGNRGPVLVVGANSLVKTAYNAFRGMDKEGLSNVEFADSLDQARTILAARDPFYAATPVR